MMTRLLSVNNLRKSYGSEQALKSISFDVSKGRIHGLIGKNGAGKSTTIKILCGLLDADDGQLHWSGGHRPAIGLLQEDSPSYSYLTVEESLRFFYEINGGKKTKVRLDEMTQLFELSELMHKKMGQLSKGQRQLVEIARCFIHSPPFIILDEPHSGLDPEVIIKLRQTLLHLAKQHTILLSSHGLHEVSILCHDVTILREGRIVISKSKEQMIGPFVKLTVKREQISKLHFLKSPQVDFDLQNNTITFPEIELPHIESKVPAEMIVHQQKFQSSLEDYFSSQLGRNV